MTSTSALYASPRHARYGFGLPTTILMLIVFSLLGLVGLSLAQQEVRSQARFEGREHAFYAAEMGLARGLQNWRTPGSYAPGTTWRLDEGELAGGARYVVDGNVLGDRGFLPLYSIRAEGYARDGTVQRVGLLIATTVLGNPVRAGLESKDSVRLAGEAEVSGNDTIPLSWFGSYCSVTSVDAPGILMPDITKFKREGSASYLGDPPIKEATDTAGFFDIGDMTFTELAAIADITLPGGKVMSGSLPAPSYNADGSCNTNDPNNWGDPESPNRPCSGWFPLIYAQGDLTLEANRAGQGVLLVEGNLTAKGGFRFFGPVLVKGELLAEGGFTFYGGVKTRTVDLGAGNAEILYSECVLKRALSHSAAARPRLLVERPWFQER